MKLVTSDDGIVDAELSLIVSIMRRDVAFHSEFTEDQFCNLLDGIFNEDFTEIEKVHDWRNHVDNAVKELWPHLPNSAKLVAYIHAADLAEREEWE